MFFLYAVCALVGVVTYFLYIFRLLKPLLSLPRRQHHFFNLFGDLLELFKDFNNQKFSMVGETINSFPKAQIVCVWFSFTPIVIFAKSEAVKEVLKTKKMVEKSFQYDWFDPLLGRGLLSSPSGKWRSRRKILNPCFHSDVLRNYLHTFNRMSQKLVKALQKETNEDFTYILDPVILCALDSVCETIFGTKIEILEEDKIRVSNCMKRVQSIIMQRIFTPWLWPEILYRNSKVAKEYKTEVKIVHDFTRKLIQATKVRYIKGDRLVYNGKHKALIDVLLEKHLDTQEFSEEDIKEEVDTFMAAGHDTVGMAVMWSVYLLGQHPEIQAKLHAEVDRVFGEEKDRAVTEEDLKELQYMDCVLKESCRIYPPVPLIGRVFTEDTNICGYSIPKGTNGAISIYFLHRDEEVFPDPEKFDPERFSAENRVKIPEFAFIPFSAGPRNCIGYKFAEIELGTIMSYLLRHFTFETLNKVVPVEGVSLHASEPIRIKIRPRTAHGI